MSEPKRRSEIGLRRIAIKRLFAVSAGLVLAALSGLCALANTSPDAPRMQDASAAGQRVGVSVRLTGNLADSLRMRKPATQLDRVVDRAVHTPFHGPEPVPMQETRSYVAMRFAVPQASHNNIRNLVFMKNSKELNREFNRPRAAAENAGYKIKEEPQTIDVETPNPIHIFAIVIDNRDLPEGHFESITKQTSGSDVLYVNPVELVMAARNSPAPYHASLATVLTNIVKEMCEVRCYDYRLDLRPDTALIAEDREPGVIRVVCTLEGMNLPVDFTVTWTDAGNELPSRPAVHRPFIDASSGNNTRISILLLTRTYLIYLILFALLAMIPLLLDVNESVVVLKRRSPHIGKSCPNESTRLGRDLLFKKGDAVVVCPRCKTAHHLGCWHLTGDTCWVRTCGFHAPMNAEVLKAHGVED